MRGWRGLAPALALGVLWANGCSNVPSLPTQPDSLPGLIVSGPLPGALSAIRPSTGQAGLSGGLVFVSLPPASVPGGTRATIRALATGQSVTVPLVDGGFDPVPIAGNVGDTLLVEVHRTGGLGPSSATATVRPRRPVVVRTSPPPRKTDVPLNSLVVIVFSQPIDPASLDGSSVKLLHGTTAVAGMLDFGDPNQVSVVLSPSAPLEPLTAYRLVVTTQITDRFGSALEAEFAADFSTGQATSSGVASVSVVPTTAVLALGDGAQLVAVVRDEQGAVMAGVPVSWTSDATAFASVSQSGLVTTLGLGEVTISAAAAGQVGTARLSIVRPPPPTDLVFAAVSAGLNHACGLSQSGRAYCWGDNLDGQLGDGTWTTSSRPVTVLGNHTFRSISAGQWFSCGITTADQAYCWGFNASGQLGTGQQPGNGELCCSLYPVAVAGGLSFRSLSVSQNGYFACGVTTGGEAWCWGVSNSTSMSNSAAPVRIAGDVSLVSISTGSDHACGLTASGQAYCWGGNRWGQLGNGDTTRGPAASPVAVAGGLSFRAVHANQYFTCGVTTNDSASCWGAGFARFPTAAQAETFCELDTCTPYFPAPVALSLSGSVETLSIQQLHSCGITPAAQAFCWGENGAGQLGTGNTTSSSGAVPVAGGLSFASLSVGSSFACGVATGGVAYCWGYNVNGQLGSGSTLNSTVPVKVMGQP